MWEIMQANPDKYWCLRWPVDNPNITWEIVEANPDIDWDWNSISGKMNITCYKLIQIKIGILFCYQKIQV